MKSGTSVQPTLEALMAGYVRRQAEAASLGFGLGEGAEVTPYETGPVHPIDAKLAWEESLTALSYLHISTKGSKAPAGWAHLVAQMEPQVAIALCVGNYPQLVRDFHKLLQHEDLSQLRPRVTPPMTVAPLANWADKANGFPDSILALAAYRLTRNFEQANAIAEFTIPPQWQPAWENERAALLWHQGKTEAAIALWRTQTPSVPVRFNLAMANLFSGRGALAKPDFEAVMTQLPESSAWHHLAKLYHTLCVLRASKS